MKPADHHPLLEILGRRAAARAAAELRILPAESTGETACVSTARTCGDITRDGWHEIRTLALQIAAWVKARAVASPKKRLRVCESVSLGEKRFIAVVQVDGEQFLVGGAPNSIAMLAQLEKPAGFSDFLRNSYEREQATR